MCFCALDINQNKNVSWRLSEDLSSWVNNIVPNMSISWHQLHLNFSSRTLWAATDCSQLWVLVTSCQWPTVRSFPCTWNICASFFTCSVFLVDRVFRAVAWLGILTFPLSPPISVPDTGHISFYFNIVYLPKSGNDLKLDPEMNRSWYSVFLYYEVRLLTFQLLLSWDFCNVLACEKISFFFIYLAQWLSYFFFYDYKYILSKFWIHLRIALYW